MSGEASRPAAVRRAGLRDVAGWSVGRDGAGRTADALSDPDAADRHPAHRAGADAHRERAGFERPIGLCSNIVSDAHSNTIPAGDVAATPDVASGAHGYASSDAGTADAIAPPGAYLLAQANANAPHTDSIPAAGAHPDAGSDSPPGHRPDLRERRGQRRRDRDDLRDRDNAGRGDGPRMPRGGRRSAGAVLDDGVARARYVGGRLRWDGQRWRGDAPLQRDGRRLWLGTSGAVRGLGSGRDAGRVDLYLVGDERRDRQSLQRIGQRRWGAGRLLGAGVMA